MADTRYPFSAPPPPTDPATEPVDDVIRRLQADTARTRSPFFPPEDVGSAPRIVPRMLFRRAEADDIRTTAEALAIKNDALDAAFNAEVDAAKIGLSGFSSLADATPPEQRVEEESSSAVRFLQAKQLEAIGQMRRNLYGDGSQVVVGDGSLPQTVDPDAPRLEHLATVSDRAKWAYRGAYSGGDGNAPLSSLEEMQLGIREAEAIRSGRMQPQVARAFQGDAVGSLARAAETLGEFFDGKEFWRSVWVDGGAGIASLGGRNYDDLRAEAATNFDRYWNELPRPAQIFFEQMNPGNVAVALGGGPAAKVLRATGVPGAGILAGLIEPLAKNPIKAVGLEMLSGTGARIGWEETEGKPAWMRFGASILFGGGVVAAEQGIEAGARGLLRSIDDISRPLIPASLDEAGLRLPISQDDAYEAAQALPPVATGYVRLFRGTGRNMERFGAVRPDREAASGRWFSSSPERAALYASRGGGISYVDVPADVAATARDAVVLTDFVLPESFVSAASSMSVEHSVLGFARANDVPLPVRAALGDGGVMKVGNPDEMLDEVADEVMQGWREGDVLGARFIPGNLKARAGRVAGSKLTAIPDIVPVRRPTSAFNVTSQATQQAGRSLMQNAVNGAERAADLAAQYGGEVPSGVMHSIQRADARVASVFGGKLSRVVNAVNGWWDDTAKTWRPASNDPAHRAAQEAAKMARSELHARLAPSRAQFIGRVREMFGSTGRLPDSIEYIGPATRPLFGAAAPAADHPLTGKIRDLFENPQFYDADSSKYLAEFVKYDARNTSVSKMIEDEFGVSVGEFDTGIGGGDRGVFFSNYDAGTGKVARGHERAAVSPGGSLRERTYKTMTERLAEASETGYQPVTDIAETFARLDEQKINRAALESYRYGIGGSRTEIPGWKEVGPLESATGAKVWLPRDLADEAASFLTSSEYGPMNALESLKNTHLGGDASPLTIQGAIGWALSPLDRAYEMARGIVTGAKQGNVLRPFTNEALFQDIAAAPERWTRFFTYSGFSPGGGTAAEWRTGFLESIPVIGKRLSQLNDGMSNALMRGMESDFDEFGTMLIGRGIPEDEAWGAASDMMKAAWLQQNFDQAGVEVGRRSVERGLLTSTTFIRQPVNFMAQAASGYAKLAASPLRLAGTAGQWTRLTPREQIAVQFFTKMQGTFAAMATISAVATAEDRGWTVGEALDRALLDTDGPDWMVLHLSKDVKFPLGGPYRSLIRAVTPQPAFGYDHVPFGGVGRFIENRATTAIDIVEDVGPFGIGDNTDFRGNAIVTEDGIRGIGQALAYAAASMAPVTLGSPYFAMRNGQSPMSALGETAYQFFGQSPMEASTFEAFERERRIGARELYNMPAEHRAALGVDPEVSKVVSRSRTLAELRRNVGSRAANALAELSNPNVGGAKQAYIDDLHRRADAGDRGAEALLVSVSAQERLSGLAETLTVNGELDRVAYREQRGAIVSEMVGQSEAFRDVFEKMRKSDSPVDRASAEWYDLFDKATTYAEVAGRKVKVATDYEAFDEIEAQFFGRIGPDMAALVQNNVAAVPLGGGRAEADLRRVRADLAQSGYWNLSDEVFTQIKPALDQVAPASVADKAAAATSFAEYRQAVVGAIAEELQAGGMAPGTAIQFAKSRFDARPDVAAYDRLLLVKKATWAQQHAQDGLAQRAIEWGYLSDSYLNLAVSGALGGGGSAAPAPSVPAQQQPPIREPKNPDTSANIDPTSGESLAAAHADGLSYGQLAQKHGLSRDAVIGRIKRFRDDRGAAAPTRLVVNRDANGRIIGAEIL